MADSEFEEFRKTLDPFPFKTASPFYTLVSVDLTEDDYTSSKSDSSDEQEDDLNSRRHNVANQHKHHSLPPAHLAATSKPSTLNANTALSSTTTTTTPPSGIGQHYSLHNGNQHGTADAPLAVSAKSSDEDDDLGDGLRTVLGAIGASTPVVSHAVRAGSVPQMGIAGGGGGGPVVERRRRKLPEIPKNRKSAIIASYSQPTYTGTTSLANELATGNHHHHSISTNTHQHGSTSAAIGQSPSAQRTMLAMKCGYLLDEDSSPDSERLMSLGDVDSGHSTAHSPTDFKSMSPPPPPSQAPTGDGVHPMAKAHQSPNSTSTSSTSHSPTSPASPSMGDVAAVRSGAASDVADIAAANAADMPFQPPPFGGIPYSQIEMLEPTHRGLHKFIPRHRDEIEVEIGDSVYVQREADDLWCEGVNLRTGRQGIFPSAYAVDLDYNDFDPTAPKVKRERYLLGYLGSVETLAHKGTGVVCQAVRKIVGEFGESPAGQLCILEISDQGLRMVDRSSKQANKEPKKPCIDYFYSLKNVSFCAFHPRDHRYIGFITKHPTIQRFACHVFKGHESTRPVAEAVGRAFQHFYQKFIETAYPIEDIYIE